MTSGGPKVLVVEDNEPLAENIAELFEEAGATVTICTNLQGALAAAAGTPPDLAMVDVRLPAGSSGLDVVPRLREAAPDGEVILMTGSATLDTAIEAVRQGVYAYVQKPFDPEDLLALGERALAQVRLRKERHALSQDLATSEALYRGVVDNVDQLILGLDEAGRVQLSNRFASDVTGRSAEELEGALFEEVATRPEHRTFARRSLEVAAAGSTLRDRELPMMGKDGSARMVRWTLSPLRGQVEVSAILAVGLDVTDRAELERRAAQSEALATMGALTAGLAHEIRNPLNAAKLQLELLARSAGRVADPALAASIRERTDIVKEEIGRLSTMLDEFLALARPRSLQRRPFSMGSVLREVAQLQGPLAEESAVEIHVSDLGEGLQASGDRDKVKQVLVNLVANAIEAIRTAGRAGRIALDARGREDGFVEVSVADDGPGLASEVAARVFEPFFTTKEAGTGLGLPVVKRIIELQGGEIAIQDNPGGGTLAWFTIPRAG